MSKWKSRRWVAPGLLTKARKSEAWTPAPAPVDPYGAVRIAATRHCRKDRMPIGTVVIRRDTDPGGRVRASRLVKIKEGGPPGRRWISYARWWWEKNRGPIPARMLVLHKDGDMLNDDPSNFILGTPGMKFIIAHKQDPAWSKDQHLRAAAGCAALNRRRGRLNRLKNFLKHYWYPVVESLSVILNIPFRRRKMLLGGFGVDVSRYPANGRGKNMGSVVQQALRSCSVKPVRGLELVLRRYGTFCLFDPATKKCVGPMSIPVDRLVKQLECMGIWSNAERQAKKDLSDRK